MSAAWTREGSKTAAAQIMIFQYINISQASKFGGLYNDREFCKSKVLSVRRVAPELVSSRGNGR